MAVLRNGKRAREQPIGSICRDQMPGFCRINEGQMMMEVTDEMSFADNFIALAR